jgi:hypothetical protein
MVPSSLFDVKRDRSATIKVDAARKTLYSGPVANDSQATLRRKFIMASINAGCRHAWRRVIEKSRTLALIP